jgi:hypothetical protein
MRQLGTETASILGTETASVIVYSLYNKHVRLLPQDVILSEHTSAGVLADLPLAVLFLDATYNYGESPLSAEGNRILYCLQGIGSDQDNGRLHSKLDSVCEWSTPWL